MSRKKIARHKAIIDELTLNPSMRLRELAKTLKATTETIRRHLDKLT